MGVYSAVLRDRLRDVEIQRGIDNAVELTEVERHLSPVERLLLLLTWEGLGTLVINILETGINLARPERFRPQPLSLIHI